MPSLPVEIQNNQSKNWMERGLTLPTDTVTNLRILGVTRSGLWAIVEVPEAAYAFEVQVVPDLGGDAEGELNVFTVTDVANEIWGAHIHNAEAGAPPERVATGGAPFLMFRGGGFQATPSATVKITFYEKG